MSYIGAMKTRKLLEKIEENLENSKEEIDELHGHMDEIKRELLDFLKEKT